MSGSAQFLRCWLLAGFIFALVLGLKAPPGVVSLHAEPRQKGEADVLFWKAWSSSGPLLPGGAEERQELRSILGKTLVVRTPVRGTLPYVAVVLHTSELSALKALEQEWSPQKVVYLEGGGRNIHIRIAQRVFALDPNNAFSEQGVIADFIEKYGEAKWLALDASARGELLEKARAFSRAVSDNFASHDMIVALHQNYPGGFDVLSYVKDPYFRRFAQAVHYNPGSEADNFAYTNTSELFNALRLAGMNVVLQDNKPTLDDGSLSYWATLRGKRFVSLEVRRGEAKLQREMIRTLNRILLDDPTLRQENRGGTPQRMYLNCLSFFFLLCLKRFAAYLRTLHDSRYSPS